MVGERAGEVEDFGVVGGEVGEEVVAGVGEGGRSVRGGQGGVLVAEEVDVAGAVEVEGEG